ncbi:MAG TPA: tetratricopeptide repeat protein [Streptosporangiaceae bacterium]
MGPVAGGPVTEQAGLRFGGLLRQLRLEAGLTQDELAEAAQVSQRAISDLERGINATARKDTAVLLAGALGLDGRARELFIAAARGRGPAGDVLAAAAQDAGTGTGTGTETGSAAAASRTLPRDIAGFTGRQDELSQLMARWAETSADGGVVSIHAIGGMAGIGKTTFAVHAAHRLAADFPDGQFFLPLHAHTPGQRPVSPAGALASLLLTAGMPVHQIPPGADARAGVWRDYVAGKRVLLVLDDAAGHQQVRPLLPGTPGSLVLITSRRRLAALEDTAVVSLDVLTTAEAAGLLVHLAGRPGLNATDAGVGQLAALCGYLPLAIGMMARQLHHHPAWTPAWLATDLAAARDKLGLMTAENVSVAAAFDLSYQDLADDRQRLFRRLGLHPGSDIDAHAAATLDDTTPGEARRGLEALYDQHLITQPAPGRYRFHDLIREHARTLAAADDSGAREAATERLLDYYLQTALAAGQHIPPSTWDPVTHPLPAAQPPSCAPPMSTHELAVAWLEAERANLHAAVLHAAASGRARSAMLIPAAIFSFLQVWGHWDQAIAEHQIAVDAAQRSGDRPGEARALEQVGAMQVVTRDLVAAADTFQEALAVYRDLGDKFGQADVITDLGFMHLEAADYQSAGACHQQALGMYRNLDYPLGQACALNGLGWMYWWTGHYPAAIECYQQALELFRGIGHPNGEAEVLTGLGSVQGLTGQYETAAVTLSQALALSRGLHDSNQQALCFIRLAMVQRLTGDYGSATASCRQALDYFHQHGQRNGQGLALDELGLAQQLAGDYPAAATSHDAALKILRAVGDREGQVQVLNSLGELAARTHDSPPAHGYFGQALTLARELGIPLEEARALEGSGRAHLHDGDTSDGVAQLEQAGMIYRRIGSPAAWRVEETLHQHGIEDMR